MVRCRVGGEVKGGWFVLKHKEKIKLRENVGSVVGCRVGGWL